MSAAGSLPWIPHRRRWAAPAGQHAAVLRDPLRVALFLLVLVSVGRIHQPFPAIAVLRPALVLVLVAVACAILNPRLVSTATLTRTWPARVVAALAVLACLSAPFGISLGATAMGIIQLYSKVLVFALLVMAAIRGVRDLWFFVWAYVISTAVLVCMCLFVFSLAIDPGDAAQRLSIQYMYDANDIGVVLLIGLPLALLTLQVSNLKGRLLCVLIVVGIGAALARTGSRSAFLGAVAVGLMLLLTASTISLVRRVVFAALIAVPLLLSAPLGYWERISTITRPTEDYNWEDIDGRKKVWLRGIGYMIEYPLFGVGIGNFQRAEGMISEKARRHVPGTGLRWTAPHNSFVQAGAELGIPGLILFSSLVLGGIWGMLRLRHRLPRSWARGSPEERFLYLGCGYFATAMAGFAVAGFFLSHAFMDHLYFLVALIAGTYRCVQDRQAGLHGTAWNKAPGPGRRAAGMPAARAAAIPPSGGATASVHPTPRTLGR